MTVINYLLLLYELIITKLYQNYIATMTKGELMKLSAKLPKGAKEKLAKDFGISLGYVRQILTGAKQHEGVLIAAVEILAEHNRKLEEAKEYIQNLS